MDNSIERMPVQRGYDRVLLVTVLCLIGISVVLIASASVMEALNRFGDKMYFMKRELFYAVASLFVGVITAAVPIAFWRRYCLHLMAVTIFLLILVLIVGKEINEAKRWINLGFFHLQPAEVLKVCWILYFSSYVCRKIDEVRTSLIGFLKPLVLVGLMSFLLLFQPDFGSLVVVTSLTMGLLWVSGAGLLKFLCTLLVVGAIGCVLVVTQPYRMRRVLSFMDPFEDKFGSGYQLSQSLMAFGRGGVTGEGVGNSIQKLGYLPEAHTDFVTAILGEELGFVGMALVITLEFVIVVKAIMLAFRILRNGPIYPGYVAFGIGLLFCLQTVINIGAASGALPTKGLTLPFVSYGGSSLFMNMAALAVLLRIDFEVRHGRWLKEKADETQ